MDKDKLLRSFYAILHDIQQANVTDLEAKPIYHGIAFEVKEIDPLFKEVGEAIGKEAIKEMHNEVEPAEEPCHHFPYNFQ